MSDNTISLSKWWLNKRLRYNKALLLIGLMGFAVQSAQHPFNKSAHQIIDGLMPEMRLAGAALIIFLILANIAFTAGSIIDLIFNHENSQSFRDGLFLIGYGIAIVSLSSCIITFLYLI